MDGWMHIAVDGMDLGPMLPITAKVVGSNNNATLWLGYNITACMTFQLPYAVVDLYGAAKSVRIVPFEEVCV